MMASWGLIALLGLFAGGGSIDIVSSLPAKEYFKARDIEVSANRLMELAVQTPDTAKKQFAQLMALSHLASDIDLIKNSPNAADHRKKLGDITQGKLANDPSNFASSYARKVLLALDGQKDSVPAKRSWKEGLKYLPEKATMVGFVDLAAGNSPDRKFPDMGLIFGMMPKEAMDQFWNEVEKIGNLQIDSIGFGISGDEKGDKIAELMVRLTGRGNPEWLIAALTDYKEDKSKERVGPAGETIRVLTCNQDNPAITIIGSSEILVGGYPPEFNRGPAKKNHQEILDRVLAQRGNKTSQGPLQGMLKADFAKVPADASTLVVGILPKEMRDGPMPMPMKVVAYGKRAAGGIDLQAFGALADEAAAKGFIEMVGKGRDEALQNLKQVQAQPMPPIPGVNFGVMIGMIESLQLQSSGSEAQLRILIPDDASMMLPMMIGMPMAMRVRAVPPPAPPPPPQKVPDKK